MAGVLAAAGYVPRARLPREVIAREWGGAAAPGERAVANHDEDSLTMAVAAALAAGEAGAGVDAVVFATTTAPYAEKQGAATIAAVLDLPAGARTTDVAGTLRAGTSGVFAAIDAVGAGSAGHVLVAAGECRVAAPDSATEQQFGDAGAAVVIGAGAGLAEIVATHTVTDDLVGTWRTSAQSYPRSHPSGFEGRHGYGRLVGAAASAVLAKAGVRPQDVAIACLPTPTPRAPMGVARGVGFDPKTQLQDGFWTTVGDTGAAQPVLMLAAALERARAGDLVLVVAYGDGADAMLLRATGEAPTASATVARQIGLKRLLPSYGRFARFRGLVRAEAAPVDPSSPAILFRDRAELLPLAGGRCPCCGVVQFPRHRICIECGATEGLAPTRLRRRGSLFTFTIDHLGESPDAPVCHGVVDLDGGGRLYCQLTDCDPGQVAIDMPLELVFRRMHGAGGFHNYFWKARPA